jgi:hypothetical protein
MSSLNQMMESAFKSCRKHEMLLSGLMILYIVLNVSTPNVIAPYVDTPLGNIVVILIALSFFTHSHPVVGVLGLFSAYILIRRSSAATGSSAVEAYVPSEKRKSEELSAFNQFPVTLEEQVVALRAPLADTEIGSATASFNPNQIDVTSLGYTQV